MTVRVLSRDPTAFFFDGAVTVEGGETSVDVVTVLRRPSSPRRTVGRTRFRNMQVTVTATAG